jgi:hypothetical protein
MRKRGLHIIFLLCCFLSSATAQRINFSAHVADESITLTILNNPSGLNFNNKQRIIVVGDPTPVVIEINDLATIEVEVDAPIEYDLTAEFTWSPGLYLGIDTGITVPFNLNFAYNNTGEQNDVSRRQSAVQVPTAFRTVTLPVRRRISGGPPLPPPTPDHEGFVRQRAKAYFYIYGTLGPIPSHIISGNYSGSIQLFINYNENNF